MKIILNLHNIWKKIVILPSHPGINISEQKKICKLVNKYLQELIKIGLLSTMKKILVYIGDGVRLSAKDLIY